MKAILGRLSELGVRELAKLLTSAGTEGVLEIESAAGPVSVSFRAGHVAGNITPALVSAFATRVGTFCFRPGPVKDVHEWGSLEDFLCRLDAHVQKVALAEGGESAPGGVLGTDPLAELRDSLAEIPLPGGAVRVLIVAADPRPYRTLAPDWQQRGWDVSLTDAPRWPEGSVPSLLILHLPASGPAARHAEDWVAMVKRAADQRPPVPTLWVGGLTDPALRHQAIVAGADFMVPAPVGEVGETARWFREELTLLAERLLVRNARGEGEAGAFRDFFLALQVDASPGEVRASLLRFAGTFFRRGILFEIRETVFESVGGFGFDLPGPVRVSRGVAPLEDVIVERRPVRLGDYPEDSSAAIAKALRSRGALDRAEALPIVKGGECLALFLGDRPLLEAGETEALAGVFARSGSLLGLA
ncbi:MAG TPA: DUF4388 domain-containing protein [Thermoanaerobaculaceae bacterium]|nr:DUF4388 domain-containing protein [Thermoanaerobaculaceae bacterium]